MGVLSFSLNYYKDQLQKLESDIVSEETIYHAKQLLKMLDDLIDEGYKELNEKLEEDTAYIFLLRDTLLPYIYYESNSRKNIYPYLLEAYGDKIYSTKYEENRLFETMYSQDVYYRFSDIKSGEFFVKKCENEGVEKLSLAEVKAVLQI